MTNVTLFFRAEGGYSRMTQSVWGRRSPPWGGRAGIQLAAAMPCHRIDSGCSMPAPRPFSIPPIRAKKKRRPGQPHAETNQVFNLQLHILKF